MESEKDALTEQLRLSKLNIRKAHRSKIYLTGNAEDELNVISLALPGHRYIKNIEKVRSHQALLTDLPHNFEFNNPHLRGFLVTNSLIHIETCGSLVSVINSPRCYKTIAEISAFSMLEKPSFVFVITKNDPIERMKIFDALWFVAHFPRVLTMEIGCVNDILNFLNIDAGKLLNIEC